VSLGRENLGWCEIRYLSAVEIDVKVVFSVLPMLLTATTMTIDRPPAMMAYSMAVAPLSSPRNSTSNLRMGCHFHAVACIWHREFLALVKVSEKF
jgi:hypothetical protein